MEYREQFHPLGLQSISVHMLRQEADLDIRRVQEDIQTYAFTQPVAVDNEHRLAELYQNEFVSAYLLFEPGGQLKFRATGDKGLQNVGRKLSDMFST